MTITLEKGWSIRGADGVNWELAPPDSLRATERPGGPYWRFFLALEEGGRRGLNVAIDVTEGILSPPLIIRDALAACVPEQLPEDAAIGIGHRHVIAPWQPDRKREKWAARREGIPGDQHAPRLLYLGSLQDAAEVCIWDVLARTRGTVELDALPHFADRLCRHLMGQVRIGRAIVGPTGAVTGVFAKGAA